VPETAEEVLLKAETLQSAIFNSANFSSIATDARGVIQIFNVGAERMLGYTAAEVMNRITPADISDPQELIARAHTLSAELATAITPGFEALVFKASREIEDIYELTYIRKDGSRFPAVVSVTALRDEKVMEMAEDRLENCRGNVVAIGQALAGRDFDAISLLGHNMRGSGGAFGFQSITDIGAVIEQAADRADAGAVLQASEDLSDYLSSIEPVGQAVGVDSRSSSV
jgi:PAS domain-containing protein